MTENGNEQPHYLGHRSRLRQRFQKTGADGLHDYELLELLLTYAIPKKDLKPLAKSLLNRFGSLTGVFDATQEELDTVKGVGPFSATLIRLVKEACNAYLAEKMKRRDALSSPDAVADFCRARLAGLPHEAFMVIFLNTKNEIIDYKVVHEGTVDRAVIYPRRIVEDALTCHASGLILVHNHPSGHPEPSEEDRRITRTIVEAGRPIDLRILDHLIVGRDGYFSFMEQRLL